LDDAALVALARAGVTAAFGIIAQRCNQRLFRVARTVLHNDGEAEDVVQEAYARAFRKLDSFRGESSLQTWLTRITINEARGRLRRRKKTVGLDVVTSERIEPSLAAESNPESEAVRSEARRRIEMAVDALPERFRLVFVMRDVEDCSAEETADALHLPIATVNSRLFRARRMLRATLRQEMAGLLSGPFPFLGENCARMTRRILETVGAQTLPCRPRGV
jgi:RNA polymerase sigma-70 factor (ECF subfamily)